MIHAKVQGRVRVRVRIRVRIRISWGTADEQFKW